MAKTVKKTTVRKKIIHDIPIHTELFRFEFPYCQGYSFTLTKEDNDALVFTLR